MYDQYEQIRQAEKERADIVAKYDKVKMGIELKNYKENKILYLNKNCKRILQDVDELYYILSRRQI